MAKDCPKLFLHFAPTFPALNMGGEVVVLDPGKKGGCDRKSPDSFWVIGKLSYSDIQLRPPEDKTLDKHYNSISRLHCTLRFEPKTQIWSCIDGAIYLSEKDTQPGEETVTASTNGVYINGRRIRINDWCAIEGGDRIHWGNDKRMLVYTVDDPTINAHIWEDENWVCRGEKEESDTPLEAADKLLTHTRENANPESTTTSWGFFSRVFDWFVTPATTQYENLTKLFLVGFVSAFLFSDEFRRIVAWFFRN